MKSALPLSTEEHAAQLDRVLVSSFLDNIPDHVYFKDRESRFVALSKSLVRYLGGKSAADIVGRTIADFFPPDHVRPIHDEEQRIICTGQPLLGRLEHEVCAEGTARCFLTHRLPLRNEAGEIVGTFALRKDVTKNRELEDALDQARKELVDSSRKAGMAEVANGVIHNVGNVLNSLNVSASVISTGLRQSKAASLAKIAGLLREQGDRLPAFLAQDPKGKRIPEFIQSLARHAVDERNRLLLEVTALQKNIDHIKEIVSMQQAYATTAGLVEPLDPRALMEDALRINADSLHRHQVEVRQDFHPVPGIFAEKAKVLQILVNFIRNAQHACDEANPSRKQIVLQLDTTPERDRVRLTVQDNGIGIPAENLTRIFGHGFTTRANGHGFGLHSAANAAREMKGVIKVHSAGPGQGASFTLELPAAAPATTS